MIAAHAGRPPVAAQRAVGGPRSRALAGAADGRAQARQRDPHPPGPPQARAQGGAHSDPRPSARSARISGDRQGLRPPAGGAQVRAREGQSDPHALPHLAEQDHRRAVGAPAQRARLVPAPIDTCTLVITGPSGVGKGTLINGLLQANPGLQLAVSATTRKPREGEENGRDYHFLSDEEFEKRVQNGEFVEHATYAGNRYGTLRSELERPARGIVLEIDLQGARQMREALPEAVQIFIEPPSLEDLRARLEQRGSDSPEQIRERLSVAPQELAAKEEFGQRVVNDDLERALDELVELAATMCPPRPEDEAS